MNLNKKVEMKPNIKYDMKDDMTDNKIKNAKDFYPMSVNKHQCIGPCYYSGTTIIHPLTLDEIDKVDYHFCPVNPFIHKDSSSREITLETLDKCIAPTARETKMDEILSQNVIFPQIHFSSEYFIGVYYKIFSLEELLKWLDDHKIDPYKTKERVFNNGMVVFGDQLTIVDHRITYFVNDIMIENLPKIYRNLKIYIKVDGDSISLINPETENSSGLAVNTDDQSDDMIEQINQKGDKSIALVRSYIKNKFLGVENIHQFMSKFLRYYKAEMTDRNLTNVLVNHMIDYCIKRIKMTFEQIE